jgi:hypothetical protein
MQSETLCLWFLPSEYNQPSYRLSALPILSGFNAVEVVSALPCCVGTASRLDKGVVLLPGGGGGGKWV